MIRAYVTLLKERPYSTNAVSATVVAVSGDALSQLVEGKFDLRRNVKLGFWGFGWMGPVGALWYRYLEGQFGAGNIAIKVGVNQIVMAPLMNGLFYFYSECWAVSPEPLVSRYRKRLEHEFLPTIINSFFFWIPTQTINFALVPLHLRPLFLNVAFVLWTANISYRGHKTY